MLYLLLPTSVGGSQKSFKHFFLVYVFGLSSLNETTSVNLNAESGESKLLTLPLKNNYCLPILRKKNLKVG